MSWTNPISTGYEPKSSQSWTETRERSISEEMETIHRLPNQCCDSPPTLELVEQHNEELRQRMSEMEHSNPSSIHGTETTSYPAGSLSENDTAMSTTNQRESEHELISEPIRHPEIRRMTPSEDIESETDDLHVWYTMRGSETRQKCKLKIEWTQLWKWHNWCPNPVQTQNWMN